MHVAELPTSVPVDRDSYCQDDDNIAANKVYSAAGGVRARAERMYEWGES